MMDWMRWAGALLLACTSNAVPVTDALGPEVTGEQTLFQYVNGFDTPCVACCACIHHHPDKAADCYWNRCNNAGTGTFCWEDALEQVIVQQTPVDAKIGTLNKSKDEVFVPGNKAFGNDILEHNDETYYKCMSLGKWPEIPEQKGLKFYRGKYPSCKDDLCRYQPDETYSPGGTAGTGTGLNHLHTVRPGGYKSLYQGRYKEDPADWKWERHAAHAASNQRDEYAQKNSLPHPSLAKEEDK